MNTYTRRLEYLSYFSAALISTPDPVADMCALHSVAEHGPERRL